MAKLVTESKHLKVFISQPFAGRTEREVAHTADDVRETVEHLYRKNYDKDFIVDRIDTWRDIPSKLQGWGEDLKMMDDADVVVFYGGWQHARGCQIEHMAARYAGKPVLYAQYKDDKIFLSTEPIIGY